MNLTIDTRSYGFPSSFEPLELLSENGFTATWRARRRGKEEQCALKTMSAVCEIDRVHARKILTDSVNAQRLLRGDNFCLARRVHSTRDYFAIEYPLLDTNIWRPVTADYFGKLRDALLPEIAYTVDFIHDEGITHGDLKLENFFYADFHGAARVKLVDMDTLRYGEARLNHITYGTPGRIAPESLDENYHSPWSDNFSLGASIRHAVELTRTNESDISTDALVCFAVSLTSADWRNRPYSLLAELAKLDLIDDARYQLAERRLLYQKALTLFRRHRSVAGQSAEVAASILTPAHKIYGAPPELLKDIANVFHRDHRSGMRASYTLLAEAERSRFGEFWHLRIDGRVSRAVYVVLAPSQALNDDTSANDNVALRGKLHHAARLFRRKEYLKAYLALSDALAHEDTPDAWTLAGRIMLARCCCRLDWTAEGMGHYQKLLDVLADNPRHITRLYLEIIYALLSCGQLEEAYQLALNGEKVSDTLPHTRRRLLFRLAQAWALSLRGESEIALALITDVAQEAEADAAHDILLKCRYYSGVVFWRQGDYEQSVQCYLDAVAVGEKYGVYNGMYAALTGLSQHFFEVGDYNKSIGYAKEAMDAFPSTSGMVSMNHAVLTLAQNHVRTARPSKAFGLLNQYINSQTLRADPAAFSHYYLTLGWASLNFGFLASARDYLWRFLEIQRQAPLDRRIAKAHQNLAEEALYRGDRDACLSECVLARESYSQFKDAAGVAEVALISYCANLSAMVIDEESQLEVIVSELASRQCAYYASVGLFHLFVRGAGALRSDRLTEVVTSLQMLHRKSQCPLFEALTDMVAAHPDGLLSQRTSFSHLKEAYLRLYESGQLYLAILLCHRIGILYDEQGHAKQAVAFLKQALSIARRLHNTSLEELIESDIARASVRHSPDKGVGELLLNISEALNLVSQRSDDVYSRLIHIVVTETGAERAALFLSGGGNGDLRTVAYHNCDPTEVKDLVNISASITRSVATLAEPLFVEEATKDDRTRHYKSVVAYNILSVMCLPLVDGSGLVGVLYLDHHTTPRFFSAADHTLAQAMSNFLAHAITLNSRHRTALAQQKQALEDLAVTGLRAKFLTQSAIMRELLDKLQLVATSNASILLCGESGVGKEILAEMIHELSGRRSGPLVKLNCAAIPVTLVESELFGVARGSVSGVGEVEGKLSAADMGTLFLDEIGDMPLEAQAKILRALEQREFQRIGSSKRVSVDTRFIFATNKDLKSMIQAGKFRDDLYYRISAVEMHIPPLRSRPEDLEVLLDRFLTLFATDIDSRPTFSASAIRALRKYSWPGNVRELRNLVEAFCITHKGATVEVHMLPTHIVNEDPRDPNPSPGAPGMGQALSGEAEKLSRLLDAYSWNHKVAAKAAGISLSTLHRKIRKFKLFQPV